METPLGIHALGEPRSASEGWKRRGRAAATFRILLLWEDVGKRAADVARNVDFSPHETFVTRGPHSPCTTCPGTSFPFVLCAPLRPAVDPFVGAPPASGDIALSTFNGVKANSVWRLYIFDDKDDEGGSLPEGWSLTITAKVKKKT